MKKYRYLSALLPFCLLALSSCANYRASSLNTLSSEVVLYNTSEEQEVVVLAKAYNKADCKRYLDRNVISKGYQPVQIYIQNNSDKNYHFSPDRISMACANSDEVAETVHTSTIGRVTAYGVGSFFIFPLIIPAIVDGLKSSEANTSLNYDFSAKTARDQVIYKHSHFNKLIFVPVSSYQPYFNITLIDDTSQVKILQVKAI
jgi:hypothetical protein